MLTALARSGDDYSEPLDREVIELATAVRNEIARSLADGDATGFTEAGESGVRTRATTFARHALEAQAAVRVSRGARPLTRRAEDLVIRLAMDMLFGLGVLQLFVDDPRVENIDVIGCDRAFVTYADGSKEMVGTVASSDDELVALIRNAGVRFGLTERRFDAAQPELDLRLPDGSRLSAVMAVTNRPIVDIRRHRLSDHDLGTLVELGSLDTEIASFLAAAVLAKRNILISGAMNSGKTTLLRALAAEIPPSERIVTIEQALELGLDEQNDRHPDCVAMEARLANTEGEGAIGMAQLVRRSLRMNASRVIVGEVLGDEVIPMLNAMSQGRSGSMGTIHADSSAGVFRRLAAYAVQSPEHLPLEATNLLIAGAIHYVVHVDISHRQDAAPTRQVVSIREVVDAEGPIVISNEIWRPGPHVAAVPGAPISDRSARVLASVGYDPTNRRGSAWM